MLLRLYDGGLIDQAVRHHHLHLRFRDPVRNGHLFLFEDRGSGAQPRSGPQGTRSALPVTLSCHLKRRVVFFSEPSAEDERRIAALQPGRQR